MMHKHVITIKKILWGLTKFFQKFARMHEFLTKYHYNARISHYVLWQKILTMGPKFYNCPRTLDSDVEFGCAVTLIIVRGKTTRLPQR